MACFEELVRLVRQTLEENINTWLISSHVVLLLLFVSFATRYRGVFYYKYYSKRDKQPKRYCTISLIPYEVLISFVLLGVPQLLWAGSIVHEALNAGAWESRNFKSGWGWAFLAYFFIIDLFERIHFRQRIIKRYYQLKAKRTLKLLIDDNTPDSKVEQNNHIDRPADEEAVDVQQISKLSFRARLRTLFTVSYPEPTAVNVLTQFHLLAFLKAFFVFTFLAHTAMFVTWQAQPIDKLFDMDAGFAVPFGAVACWMAVRFFGLFVRGIVFGRHEVDFAAVNARDGQLRL